ncbi:MAG: TetR/AcrR family transcriptional regulator [Leptospiraceae bacterium]|nr:TetR/AcrR family transcriptional regulator [Leptospiraceae bacterium]MDW8306433.1 TetR/AcrR family transcriptional regulator [Leptospiraceae bacterium]
MKENHKTTPKTLGKREITKQVNRQQILDAAFELFCKQGFEATNVRDIIRESGLSAGTFYNYFQSKEEIFEELKNNIIEDLRIAIRAARWRYNFALDKIVDSFKAFFQVLADRPKLMLFLSRNQSYLRQLRSEGGLDVFLRDLEEDLQKAMDSGRLPPMPVHIVSLALFGTIFELVSEFVRNPQFSIEETSQALAKLFYGAFNRKWKDTKKSREKKN